MTKTVEVKITMEELQELCRKKEVTVELRKALTITGMGKPLADNSGGISWQSVASVGKT